jgi:hypothetical protein
MNTSPEWVAEPPGWRLGLLQLKARPPCSTAGECAIYVLSCQGSYNVSDRAMAQHQQILMHMQAMLWRQWLLKKRSLASTIVEVISPIVLISMLVSHPVLLPPCQACLGSGLPTVHMHGLTHANAIQFCTGLTDALADSLGTMCRCLVAGMCHCKSARQRQMLW